MTEALQIGERVLCIAAYDSNEDIVDLEGEVICIDDSSITIQFDSFFTGGHSSNGRGLNGHCWDFYLDDSYRPLLRLSATFGPPAPPWYKIHKKCKTLWNRSSYVTSHQLGY